MPPGMGAAMRPVTSWPVPVPQTTGRGPARITATVIALGPQAQQGAFRDGAALARGLASEFVALVQLQVELLSTAAGHVLALGFDALGVLAFGGELWGLALRGAQRQPGPR
ncbi:MAG: hypothetical protein C0505_05275 [Leptothrix sp. (in: Bacteria)]|nr:hypothetical protein [Leptothrix sp. (in: b-proteobacteria)]